MGPSTYSPQRGTHHFSTCTWDPHLIHVGAVFLRDAAPRCQPCAHPVPLLACPTIPLSPTVLCFFSGGGEARQRRTVVMSSSSSAAPSKWPKYGEVPLLRCPECPRVEPLKRMRCKHDDNGNLGREFVKCLSMPVHGGQVRSSIYFLCYFTICFFYFR